MEAVKQQELSKRQRRWSVNWFGWCLPYGFIIWYHLRIFHSEVLYRDDEHEVILRQRVDK
jgi:hypothetical protein